MRNIYFTSDPGIKVRRVLHAAGLVFLMVGFMISGCERAQSGSGPQKMIILGFDGMDPQILDRLIKEGKMPNFEKLMNEGSYMRLGTSVPPQSPVAWSNFITGMNPGGHRIFDFIHRDPETMIPYLSTSEVLPAETEITLGDWVIPLSSDEIMLLRKGKAFWQILEEHGMQSTIMRVPANFPPVETEAETISGMGTPDIQGTYGVFSYFTTDKDFADRDITGGKVFTVKVVNNMTSGKLFGPKNVFKKGEPRSSADFRVYLDPENPVAMIVIQGERIVLNEGEWSDWVRVEFETVPLVGSVKGICRFYLKEAKPGFKLYVTPVNIDPADPAMPVSTPGGFAEELSNALGPFYTQGMPEDTKALSEGILDDNEFLQQARIVFSEYLKMYEYELTRFHEGLLFYYFGSTDQLTHMFWRSMDPDHPLHDPFDRNTNVIEKTYMEMDNVLGRTFRHVDDNTTLIILSDHGFAPFHRSFNLNTWLVKEGYLSLRDGKAEGEFFENVQWSDTKAYGLGFNGLYLNLYGREAYGIVEEGRERDELVKEISEKLLAVRDPKTGQKVISSVYRAEEVYSGPYVKDAPDLIIGYHRGFRSSWETVLGKFPKGLFQDNREKWSGTHLIATELVPGIILTNKKIESSQPALYDIAPTVLQEFGIEKNEEMVGEAIF